VKKETVPVDSNVHRLLKYRKAVNFAHLEGLHMVPVFSREYMHAGNNFPIGFVKDAATGEFISVGILGLEEGENLIFTEVGAKTSYIPLDVRRNPFYVAGDQKSEGEMRLCVDINSPLLP
jgi:hypothetical protein